jgi:TatD DNase family protein
MHCVRGYGHLLQLFSSLTRQPNSCPPKVMLHSYGGSVEEIPKFCKLRGIGKRFYFSFSHAINARTPEKLAARIAAVPDDRLLIESDQVDVWLCCIAALLLLL